MIEDITRAVKIDHFAVAVKDLDESVDLFSRLLGIEPLWCRESEEFKVRIAAFQIGDVKLELLEGSTPDSTVSRFLSKHGPGLHHVCYAVKDLKATLKRLESEGFELIGSGDDIGVEGRAVSFVHPKSSGSVLTEFIEWPDQDTE